METSEIRTNLLKNDLQMTLRDHACNQIETHCKVYPIGDIERGGVLFRVALGGSAKETQGFWRANLDPFSYQLRFDNDWIQCTSLCHFLKAENLNH